MDAQNESEGDKIRKLEEQNGELQGQLMRYKGYLETLRDLVYGSKQRMDRAVYTIEKAGFLKFEEGGVYPFVSPL